jgi:hypothetical protein
VYGTNTLVDDMSKCSTNSTPVKYVMKVQYGLGALHCQKSYGRFETSLCWKGRCEGGGRFVSATWRRSK